ncbi:MAG TPA: hypothetical protein VK896_12320, partial [Gaiellaceae bacterium]|nr:hypothetical protein [Gaiellaceae bacterium]
MAGGGGGGGVGSERDEIASATTTGAGAGEGGGAAGCGRCARATITTPRLVTIPTRAARTSTVRPSTRASTFHAASRRIQSR